MERFYLLLTYLYIYIHTRELPTIYIVDVVCLRRRSVAPQKVWTVLRRHAPMQRVWTVLGALGISTNRGIVSTEASLQRKLHFSGNVVNGGVAPTDVFSTYSLQRRMCLNGPVASTEATFERTRHLNVRLAAAEAKFRRRKSCSESFNSTEASIQRKHRSNGGLAAQDGVMPCRVSFVGLLAATESESSGALERCPPWVFGPWRLWRPRGPGQCAARTRRTSRRTTR